MRITRKWLEDHDACYHEDRIASLIPKSGLTIKKALKLDVPICAKLWVGLRLISMQEVKQFANWCAQRAALSAETREVARRPAQAAADYAKCVSSLVNRYTSGNEPDLAGYSEAALLAAGRCAYAAYAATTHLYCGEREKQLKWLVDRIGKIDGKVG